MSPRRTALLGLAWGVAACTGAPPAPAEGWSSVELTRIRALSPIPPPPPSPTNRVADDPEAATLGKVLFFDPGFSAGGNVSCATCHDPARHFTDGKRTARTPLGEGERNTPSIESAPWSTWLFWDGRADSAWAQATGPIRNPIEHGFDAARVRARVVGVYAELWRPVFGEVSEDPDRVLTELGKAIEAFERTLSPGASRFDRYVAELGAGDPASTLLSEEERRGLRLFIGAAACVSCHNGPLFTDKSFHNLGIPSQTANASPGRMAGAPRVLEDPFNCRGVYADHPDGVDREEACAELRFLDPTFPDWALAFKTPSLRNVAETAPYMHDGTLATLGDVLQFYNVMPGEPVAGHRELTLRPLGLEPEDLAAIEAFLRTLSAG